MRSVLAIAGAGLLGFLVGRNAARQAIDVEAARTITTTAALRDVQRFAVGAFDIVSNLAVDTVGGIAGKADCGCKG